MKDQPTSACGGMRVLSKTVTLTRRGFLQGGAVALGAVAAGPAALAAAGPEALARTFPTLGGATAHTLVRMARDVFPHDRLADRYYVEAIVPLARAAHADKAQAALLKDGVRALDKAAHARYGKAYAAVKREPERVALLKSIETTPFFERVRSEMVTSLYDNKAVWPLLGYEGSSWEKGGYLNRGFNDIDWL